MKDFRSDLSKVRGYGAAKGGVHEFIVHRVSALFLAILFPFFIYGLLRAFTGGYEGLIGWVGSWGGAFVLIGVLSAGLFHGRLGINEIISDYVSSNGARSFFMILNSIASLSFWLLGVLAVLKIWLGS